MKVQEPKKTMIIGASANSTRYSYLVANKLVRKGYEIVNVGRGEGKVGGVPIEGMDKTYDDIHTITIYVSPSNQPIYEDYILKTNPKRIIFNPGAENESLSEKAKQKGIETIDACTLVMLNTGQF